ncbi:Ripening-related protein grip22 [Vitis vinifera]|uniref:Ripening-related protein grip22 n=1 Tax=Vitis vinifera TaxID=29760 RepID=A0A438CGG8_VITVI|nr:Ripening-related protein grip22 [Vitis vinifera]
MANSPVVWLASVWLVSNILSLPFLALGISSCGGSCQHLMTVKVSSCIDGKCNDDPEVGTHINGGSSITPPPPPPGTCQPSGTLACNGGKPKIPTHALLRSPPPRLPF